MARTALIIGSGVAGPAMALFLRRLGWQPAIYEAAAEPDDYAGSFLNVATNGLSVLHTLGLRDRLRTDAHHWFGASRNANRLLAVLGRA